MNNKQCIFKRYYTQWPHNYKKEIDEINLYQFIEIDKEDIGFNSEKEGK